jgi:dTMP kinase
MSGGLAPGGRPGGELPPLPEDATLDDSALAGMGSGYKGLFISFEGLDGCGKSTQMDLLAAALRERGYVVLITREPGGTTLGESIREVLLDPRYHGMSARAEALLYAAARAHLVEQVIRPALKDGQVVLCDRYIDSSLAYQGYGRGLGTDDIITLNVWATECLFPDLTLFLDLDDDIRSTRMATVPDRLEAEDEEFHRRVGRGFRELLLSHPHRIRRVDARGSETEVQERVRAVVESEFELFSH